MHTIINGIALGNYTKEELEGIIKLLLEKGASKTITNQGGQTPLALAEGVCPLIIMWRRSMKQQ